ncbi:hypothetical protein ACFL2Q_08830, partial [Thermodesulfobacteriota bacterium]
FQPWVRGQLAELTNSRCTHYWELVVHYTDQESFLGIMQPECIQASPTGYFAVPAVCLTEAPIEFNQEFLDGYGECGIVFTKGKLKQPGGGPAGYLLDQVITAQLRNGGFYDELRPFVNVLRIAETVPAGKRPKRVDFLHDREWRYPGDLKFSDIAPIGVILPPGSAVSKFMGPGGQELLNIAWRFKEVRQ